MTQCPKHPGVEAVGTCVRCGRFHCAVEARSIDGSMYCGDCAERDDVDWLGKHYRPFEGKRSGLVWVLLLVAAPLTVGAISLLSATTGSERLLGASLLAWGLPSASLVSGHRAARWVFLGSTVVSGVLFGFATDNMITAPFVTAVLATFAVAPFRDVRTRLFFRDTIDRGDLKAHFARYGSNPLAVTASRLAFVSLVVPGLGVVSFVLGLVALFRVDKKAVPPVGNVGTAIGAMVFSLFTSFMWAVNLM